MDDNSDIISGDPDHTEDVEQLKSLVSDNGFRGTWRMFYEDDKEYSRSRKILFIASRFGYIFWCQTIFSTTR